jgi:AraC-like DNA-binding protein
MTISATMLRLFVEALDELRVDSRQVLETCGLDPAVVRDPEAGIDRDDFERIWLTARELSGDACIGLHAGANIHPHAVNLFGYLMLSSASLGAGIARVARYQRVLSDVPWMEMLEEGDPTRIRVGALMGGAEFQALHSEYLAAFIPRVMSWISEVAIVPHEVRFRHEARGVHSEYASVLRCPVHFGAAHSELVFRQAALTRSSLHAEESIARLHEEHAERLLARRGEGELSFRVRCLLSEYLESGETSLASVARRLGMSARSLQRRLAEEGTSFRSLLDELRREVAREYLERNRVPIAGVAHLAGFSDVSAFTRATTRWFGETPARLREHAEDRSRAATHHS